MMNVTDNVLVYLLAISQLVYKSFSIFQFIKLLSVHRLLINVYIEMRLDDNL